MLQSQRLGLTLLVCAALPCVMRTQTTVTNASVTGRVVDATGALIAKAAVTAQSTATSQTYSATTDDHGRFRLPYVPVGVYTIRTSPQGFAETSERLELTVGSVFDVTLVVGASAVHASISVSARASTVEEDRSAIAATIEQEQVDGLPFNGRNALDLALLTPGVSATNTASVQTFAETSPVVGQGYSVNSQRNFSNSFVVDGLSANDDAAGLVGNSYSMDAIAEMQVVTSGGQAEFGRAMGGYLNIVTRSGGNDVHGTLYGFLRNKRLNAANALSQTTLPMTQAQYGGSVSGPLQRNRTFVFVNYEGRRLNTDGVTTITPANTAAINARLDALGFTGPRLAIGSGASTLYPTTVHTDNAFARVDRRIGASDQFSARYSGYWLSAVNARGAGALADVSYGTAVNDTNQTVALSNLATISSRLFNETRAQFTRDDLEAPPNTSNAPAVTISGVAMFGRFSSSPTARVNYLYEVVDNVLTERGAHTLKTGVDWLFNDDRIVFPMASAGSYTFASLSAFQASTTGYSSYSQNFGVGEISQRNPNVGMYAQDEWKAAARLTVNAGIRYDLQFLRTIATDTNNVSPRVGFAYPPFRTGRTLLRASFGLFYDRVALRPLANALLSANNTTDPAQARLLQYTYVPANVGAPAFPQVSAVPNPAATLSYTLMSAHLANAYSEQLSLGIEQQVLSRTTLEVSYQHLLGVHLLGTVNHNINPDGSRPDLTRGNVKSYDADFNSQYDGMNLSLVERPVAWGSARLSYAWSKATDDVGEFFFSAPINNALPREDRARSDDDQRHRLTAEAILHSPVAPGTTAWQRGLYGWEMSGIVQYDSRLPFNIVTGGQTLQQTSARPCISPYTLTGTNPCTEGLPGAVIGRNAGVGFDFFSISARLARTFALTEHIRMEAMAEAFNALNHRNSMIPNGTWGTGMYPLSKTNAQFGAATAVGDPRSVQLALRLRY